MCLAEWTGLEPATPGVTGRYSNQLNYHSASVKTSFASWWVLTGSNRRHPACKASALPSELSTRISSLSAKQRPLVYSILERFSSTKLRYFCSLDLDRCPGLRITAGASSALGHVERAEPNQANLSAFLERALHGGDGCIERTSGSCLGKISRLGDLINQFRFVHKSPLQLDAGNPAWAL